MNRDAQRVRDLTLVAGGLIVAIVVVAISVSTSVDHHVSTAVNRVGVTALHDQTVP